MRALDLACEAALGADLIPDAPVSTVPARPGRLAVGTSPPLLRLRLWQLGFGEAASMKGTWGLKWDNSLCDDALPCQQSCICLPCVLHAGAPNNADLIPIMEQNIRAEGNQTELYPLQVLFELLGKKPGEPVSPFSIGISIGMGTTMGAFLTVVAALQMDILGMSGGPASKAWRQIAGKLIKCLRVTCTYEPAANTQEQVRVRTPRWLHSAAAMS